MSLSNDLISQFIKATNDNNKADKKETIVYGTTVEENGSMYVKIDGSNQLTPVSTTAGLKTGERVTVMIKNHSAVVTGNITSPSATSSDLAELDYSFEEFGNKISEFEIVVADKVSAEYFDAEVARIDDLVADNVVIKKTLVATEAEVEELQAENVTITEKLTANEAEISTIKTDKLDTIVAEATYATIEELDATNVRVNNLEATYGDFSVLTTGRLDAVDASVSTLKATSLTASDITGKFANIDFSNIGKAAIEHFYATSGLIEDVVVDNGTITGRLVGVTISGDLIEGNTVKAEKLVIKGSDGLYYKLNTDGMVTEAQQTDQNSINGSIIKSKSITATKISVSDLVAFGATIGGFKIADHSIYSGAKSSVGNTTRGIYMDDDGQIAFGDASNYVKFFKDTDGNYRLNISADRILLASSNDNVETAISEASSIANDAQERVAATESLIEILSESISMLVTDGNGASLMTQTESGWTFSTADIQSAVNRTSEALNDLTDEVGDTNHAVSILQQAVDDLGEIAEYVKIGTYEDEPCIELGEGDSDFKLRITNTRMMFVEGSSVLAYFNNQSLHIKKAVVEEELQQGGFVWKARSNGNLGLVWKGGAS